ncbi:MAG TPA: family 43 glycosylhydrolase [Actinophytocola sp.]|uniref:family 43 glycosylhydrolase n=1 Tax=Actinophytocola sp. TaxID=1872138 RepID=UPI002DDCAE39|nr:family 43 glycosylhydrolase [Actinophytocola sp.]HEV2783030.1 family 43 glycosylhydrolase [Actinophytocola sp.]
MHRLLVLLIVVITAFGMGVAPASAAPGRPFTNPIKAQKGADPWLVYFDGNYYQISTTFTNSLIMRKSPTLAGIATAPSVQVWQDTMPSRGANFWAPELHFLNGRWYLYYSGAQVGAPCCDTQRTHVLESVGSDPLGPYTYRNILTTPASASADGSSTRACCSSTARCTCWAAGSSTAARRAW